MLRMLGLEQASGQRPHAPETPFFALRSGNAGSTCASPHATRNAIGETTCLSVRTRSPKAVGLEVAPIDHARILDGTVRAAPPSGCFSQCPSIGESSCSYSCGANERCAEKQSFRCRRETSASSPLASSSSYAVVASRIAPIAAIQTGFITGKRWFSLRHSVPPVAVDWRKEAQSATPVDGTTNALLQEAWRAWAVFSRRS